MSGTSSGAIGRLAIGIGAIGGGLDAYPGGPAAIPWLGAEAFLGAALALLPQGEVWPDGSDRSLVQAEFWAGVATVQAAVHQAAATLTEIEADPAQTLQLLDDWETDYGLPDLCTPADPTFAQRRGALLQKIAAQGTPLLSYFVSQAALIGYAITIVVTAPNQWTVHCPAVSVNYFRVGESTVGEPLAWATTSVLECRLKRIVPAWIQLLFSYP